LAVVHVQPLGRRDEDAQVAGARVAGSGEEEVDVQSGKLAGGEAQVARGAHEPRLPPLAEQVMADVGRIADEQRPAPRRRERDLAVVAYE
jgi:hypothetical protein